MLMKRMLTFACLFLALSQLNAQVIRETGDWKADQEAVLNNLEALNGCSYKEFCTYSEDIQRFIFSMMDPVNKARIWRERIDHYLATNNESGELAKLLRDMQFNVLPDVFDGKSSRDKLESLVVKAVKLAGKDKIAYIVTTMRPSPLGIGDIPSPSPGNSPPATTTLSCNCSQTSDWCFSSAYCKTWTCNLVTSGCGTFWSYDCNGRCYTPNN